MRGTKTALVGLLAGLTVFPETALACGCVSLSESDYYVRAVVAFVGTVRVVTRVPNADRPDRSWLDSIEVDFSEIESINGDPKSISRYSTASDGGLCGIDFVVGGRYFVVVSDPSGQTTICSGGGRLDSDRPDSELIRSRLEYFRSRTTADDT